MTTQTWILLRGLVREQRHWEGFPGLLAQALPGAHILTPDLPGNGSRCREASPASIAGMVDGLRQELAAGGESGPFHVLALSLGAMTAFEWMARHPGEVAGAVLVNTSLAAFSPPWHRLRLQNWPAVAALAIGGSALQRERWILRTTTNRVADTEAVARRWAGFHHDRPVSRANALRQLVAAARYRRPARAPACPVLLLNGAGDRLVDPRCSDALARHLGLPLLRHPAAGHDLTLDDGAWVAAQARAFAGGQWQPPARETPAAGGGR